MEGKKKSNEKGEKSRKATKVKLKERGKAEVGDAPKGKEPKVMRKSKERKGMSSLSISPKCYGAVKHESYKLISIVFRTALIHDMKS